MPKANSWALRLLLTQLYDPAPEVHELAVRILEDACESSDVLELVVEMQPALDHLGEIGDPLLLKYAISPHLFEAAGPTVMQIHVNSGRVLVSISG